ncbi:hypothetical protein DC522_20860 [Microvirga sp. KLBC 81]|nr:hypothetical protein DC522_20860 [Microvirga sp. KLBC 81]
MGVKSDGDARHPNLRGQADAQEHLWPSIEGGQRNFIGGLAAVRDQLRDEHTNLLHELVTRIARRDQTQPEAEVQSDLRQFLLTAPFELDEGSVLAA